ncbi:MAG TPA: hypothetical protein VHC18_28385 [Amycolatopsis sp.]|nr:hypothetical protein [Amycolatopsis sp.]
MAYKGSADDVAPPASPNAATAPRYVSGVLLPVDGALVASSW